MSKLNRKGPEEKGPGTGRKLGKCFIKDKDDDVSVQKDVGMGKKRKVGGGVGKGKRLRCSFNCNF